MGKMLPSTLITANEGSSSPTRGSSPTKTLEEARRETALARTRPALLAKTSSTDSETPPSTSAHRAYSFKFSLEYAQHFERPANAQNGNDGKTRQSSYGGNDRRISPPRLPAAAQAWLGAKVPGISKEVGPKDPTEGGGGADALAKAKYAGRALAEWAIIVGECNNFVERRRAEGVPTLRWVEVPTLGVEGFRKFG